MMEVRTGGGDVMGVVCVMWGGWVGMWMWMCDAVCGKDVRMGWRREEVEMDGRDVREVCRG